MSGQQMDQAKQNALASLLIELDARMRALGLDSAARLDWVIGVCAAYAAQAGTNRGQVVKRFLELHQLAIGSAKGPRA